MTIQTQVGTAVVYAPETTFGTRPSGGGASKTLRRVTTSLLLGKDVYSSNEARADYQLVDARHGTHRAGGSIEGELSIGSYDDFIEALLRGTWAAGVTSSASDYTTVAGANVSGTSLAVGSTGTFTWTAGDPVAKGMRIGDVIRTVGTPSGANDSTNFRITGFGGSNNRTISVTPSPATFAATAVTSFNVAGKKVSNGTVRRSFTMEQVYGDIAVSELFTGMRAGSGNFRMPPNGNATLGLTFMGQDGMILDAGTTPTAPYFSAATPAGTGKIVAGPTGSVRFAGAEQAILTSLDMTIDNSLQMDPVIGNVIVPDVFYGQQRVNGNISFFLQDSALMKVFQNETEVDLTATLLTAGALPDFISINMQRVKTTGLTKSVGAQGGVVVTTPFVALLASAGVGVDGSTLTVQRSN